MQFNAATITALLLGAAVASPNPQLEAVQQLERRGEVTVWTHSGDVCDGASEQVHIGQGGFRCFQVSNKRSIRTQGNCIVTTWSGTDCRGSSFRIDGSGCWSVLYGSVTIQC